MAFSGDTFTHLYDWLLDLIRNEKIKAARLEEEFDGYDTGLSAVAARVTTLDTATREMLTANRTYYVRTDGSDSNTGLVDSAAGAFLTIQKAIDTVAGIDLSTFDVTIDVANATWTPALTLKSLVGDGTVTIFGDSGTPSNVVISTTSAAAFTAENIVGKWKLQGLKIQTTTSGNGIFASGNVQVDIANLDFGACAAAHISPIAGAIVRAVANYAITGNAERHINATSGGKFLPSTAITVTLTGTPAFSTAFVQANRLGSIQGSSITYSGSATGKRYDSQGNSCIFTNGGGANFFPGDVAGTTTADGEYL